MSSLDARLKSKGLFSKIFLQWTVKMLNTIYILRDNFLTVWDFKKLPRMKSSWKVWGNCSSIEHFSVFCHDRAKNDVTLSKFWFLNLVLDVWIGNSDFKSRPKLNVDPIGSRSETLHPDKSASG
jgi:hypothetical protein